MNDGLIDSKQLELVKVAVGHYMDIILPEDAIELYKLLWVPIRVYVVKMPYNVGGGVVGVYWQREDAERAVKGLESTKMWEKEKDHRIRFNLEPLGEHVIQESFIGSLASLGE